MVILKEKQNILNVGFVRVPFSVSFDSVMNFFQTIHPVIYTLIGITGLIGILIKIYEFIQRRKERLSRLDRDIHIKEVEIETMRHRHLRERVNLEASYEGDYGKRPYGFIDFRTEQDRQRYDQMWQRQRMESEIVWAEYSHLYEQRNGNSSALIPQRGPWSHVQNMKKKMKELFGYEN